ncbi:MAG TPA: polysaccharide deacetylase family protein [Solirubrobacteraceae bacterium]|jgi:peptidoglycan/xylan/chitin deacetylase (PgdA/CDA1 family)|nr:polysaccharide deacetylase family protein [Solirubrobacteraceae bacterium]
MSTPDHRTRSRRTAGAVAGLAMGSYLLPALAGSRPVLLPRSPAPIWPGLRRSLGVEDRTASGSGCALTFDDGPHAQGTPAVLEILAGAGARATFFLVGEQVRRNPGSAAEIVAAGHEVALHCDRHRNLLRLAPWQVRADIARALASIEDATGRSPSLYRPPYGVLNATALRVARSHGWRTLLWSQWGRDWEARATPESIAARVTTGTGEGSVLLLHDADDYSAPDSWRRTAAALPRVLETLAQRGLQPAMP